MRYWIVVASLLASGCTLTKTARLYDLQTAQVVTATFKTNGTGTGPILIGSASAPECRGEYVTVANGTTAWGAIYGQSGITQAVASSADTAQRGSAVATCMDGRVIECEYITSSNTGAGNGSCRDNRNRTYRLMF